MNETEGGWEGHNTHYAQNSRYAAAVCTETRQHASQLQSQDTDSRRATDGRHSHCHAVS